MVTKILLRAVALAAALSASLFFTATHATAGRVENKATETFRDIIAKARQLTLQRERSQACVLLIQSIQRETKNSLAYRELQRALDDLGGVFYTEKAQNLFSLGEALQEVKPKEAADKFQEALRLEEGNVSIFKALAHVQLQQGECDKAEVSVKGAESTNPFSAEIRLLHLQMLDCQKNFELLTSLLAAKDVDLEPVEKILKTLQIKELFRKKDLKKARLILASWEAAAPEFPEVYFWKWQISMEQGLVDRSAALKYSNMCQNLTPRRKKSFILDLDLCKGKERVDAYLRKSGYQEASPMGSSGG